MEQNPLFFQDRNSPDWLDEQLFNEVFQLYWKKLFGFCRHHLQDTETCKEIVQQVFLSLWERRKQLDIQANIGHYLFGAVRLGIAEYFRKMSYQKEQLACNGHGFCDTTNNTEEAIHFQDLSRYVESLVDRLPCRCRQVYTLSRNRGLTITEIADELGISVKTTEAHLTKALKYLRTEIRATET